MCSSRILTTIRPPTGFGRDLPWSGLTKMPPSSVLTPALLPSLPWRLTVRLRLGPRGPFARYPSPSSAARNSVRAFERITSTAPSRESPAMSVSHTNASMPSVAPIP